MNPSKLVFDLRNHTNITQKELARGLVSILDISRFEMGMKEFSYFMIEALVQRLGKSCDKFELSLNPQDYNALFLRQLMFHNLKSDPDLMNRLYEAYEQIDLTERSLHNQFLLMIKGCAAFIKNKDAQEAYQFFTDSLDQTFPEWKGSDWDGIYLCTQEMQIILLTAYCAIEIGTYDISKRLLTLLKDKISEVLTDKEEKARVYPQFCYLMIEQLLNDSHDLELIRFYIREGIQCISESGVMTLAKELLELEILYDEEPDTARSKRDAVQFASEKYGFSDEGDILMNFVLLNQHKEIILINELIRDTREHQKISQAELSWEICATETLSRIESGKRAMRKNNRIKLYEKLGLDTVNYQVMETDDFRILEMDRDMRGEFYKENYTVAKELFSRIRNNIDMQYPENRQYILLNSLLLDVAELQVTYTEAIEKLKEMLKITICDYEGKIYRMPTRNEFDIFMQIVTYEMMEQLYEDAESILVQLYQLYHNSAVAEEHHARENMILYNNLCVLMIRTNRYEEAEKYAISGMRLASFVRRGDLFGTLMRNLAVCYRKMDNYPDDDIKNIADASYWIYMFYNHEKTADDTKRIFSL